MPCAYPSTRSRADNTHFLVQSPPFWVSADIALRFPGLPATYTIDNLEDLREFVADPMGFAADLAGLSRVEYQRRLEGGPL